MAKQPDFLVQSAKPMTVDERREWFNKHATNMREKGAAWLQFSVDDADEPKVSLVEGWRVRPKKQPPPHFQMTYA